MGDLSGHSAATPGIRSNARSRSPSQSREQSVEAAGTLACCGNLTLRTLLEEKDSEDFRPGGVADVPVDAFEVDHRLAAMQQALVAHDAMIRMLSQVDMPARDLPNRLVDAIAKAEELELIHRKEVKCLKRINSMANKAKHNPALPF